MYKKTQTTEIAIKVTEQIAVYAGKLRKPEKKGKPGGKKATKNIVYSRTGSFVTVYK